MEHNAVKYDPCSVTLPLQRIVVSSVDCFLTCYPDFITQLMCQIKTVIILIIPDRDHVSASVRMLTDWLVCQQDYTKTTERISTKLRRRVGVGPE